MVKIGSVDTVGIYRSKTSVEMCTPYPPLAPNANAGLIMKRMSICPVIVSEKEEKLWTTQHERQTQCKHYQDSEHSQYGGVPCKGNYFILL